MMSNIKSMYWVPCLGVAFMWNDPECSLSSREERALIWYHAWVIFGIVFLGAALLVGFAPG